jgi:hypothetical protein
MCPVTLRCLNSRSTPAGYTALSVGSAARDQALLTGQTVRTRASREELAKLPSAELLTRLGRSAEARIPISVEPAVRESVDARLASASITPGAGAVSPTVADLPNGAARTLPAAAVDITLAAVLLAVLTLVATLSLLDALLASLFVVDLLAFFQLVTRVGLSWTNQGKQRATQGQRECATGANGSQDTAE